MEKRIVSKTETYMSKIKNDMIQHIMTICIDNDKKKEIMQYVIDYPRLTLTNDDFLKRKRVKNNVPHCDRCLALRANNEQCSRRKKDDNEYCGTHMKGVPYGVVSGVSNSVNELKKIEVCAQEIRGIYYYIDKNNNVYSTSDVISNKECPRVIARYTLTDGVFNIPEFGI